MAERADEKLLGDLAAGRDVVLMRRLPGDLETPVSAYLKLADQPWSALLESVEGGRVRGRYSIIGFAPDRLFRIRNGQAELAVVDETAMADAWQPVTQTPLQALRQFIDDARMALAPDSPPMLGAVIGYLGYDMVREIEHLGAAPPDPYDVPGALFMRPTKMAIFDAVRDEILLAVILRPDDSRIEAPARLARARADIDAMEAALARPVPAAARWAAIPDSVQVGRQAVRAAVPPGRYAEMVMRAKEHIFAGDIFQVVLAQRFSRPFTLPAFTLYRALRRLNPAPFLFFLRFGDFALTGSSPEILVRVQAGEVTIRPIAGTRPRGETRDEDTRLAAELLADPKERAEHLMLLDLGRNDVGRVAVPGTVRVAESFVIERYSHVMHIVSEVRGRLDTERADVIDALMAGFPAGTVSGAPKVRAMEIIDALEPEGRGPYAGAVGYFAPSGDMDSCIVLRTALVKDGWMHVHAGAGIVADSVPAREQAECENKARALIRAAEIAEAAATGEATDR